MIVELKGIKIRLTFSFVAILVIMLVFFDENVVVMSAVSSLAHECGHLALMLLFRDKPDRIELGLFGMRIEKSQGLGLSYKREFIISLGGIGINAVLSVLFLGLYNVMRENDFLRFSAVNLLIALVNSVPVSILDMGRGVRFLLLMYYDENKSEKIANRVSCVSVTVISLLSLFYSCSYGLNPSLIAVVIYLYTIIILKKRS